MAIIKKPLLGDLKKKKSAGKKSIDELILEARMQLEKARSKNQLVIEAEIRNVRYDRKHNVNKIQEAKSITKIKNAYYALSVIDKAKIRLNDIETTQELSSAMNDITNALKLINTIHRKSEKSDTGKFMKENKKLDKALEKDDENQKTMYHKVENIDDLVSDDVVERIIKGEPAADCLKNDEGIIIPMDELPEINLDDIRDFGAETDSDTEKLDLSALDFSDF